MALDAPDAELQLVRAHRLRPAEGRAQRTARPGSEPAAPRRERPRIVHHAAEADPGPDVAARVLAAEAGGHPDPIDLPGRAAAWMARHGRAVLRGGLRGGGADEASERQREQMSSHRL